MSWAIPNISRYVHNIYDNKKNMMLIKLMINNNKWPTNEIKFIKITIANK